MMVPIKVCNAPQIFTRDLTGLPPNLVRFVTLSDYLGTRCQWARPILPATPGRLRRSGVGTSQSPSQYFSNVLE